jgi:radical SAM protein with 4Fe4S-binding SPASM domain
LSFSGDSFNNQRKNHFSDVVPERDAEAILQLLPGMQEKDVVICLYGGEPLMAIDKIERLYRILSTKELPFNLRFMVYTNGQLLREAIERHGDLMSYIWLFSLSIDGRETQHNKIRVGTDLASIHKNLRLLKDVRKGPLLMWSTLRDGQSLFDCFEEFLELKENGFADHFFWHWVETRKPFQNYAAYIAKYEEDLRRIMDNYVHTLSRGEALSIIHINELILYLLTGKKRGTTGCGVEVERNFDIVGGKIYACADLPLSEPIGHIEDNGTPHFKPYNLSLFTTYKSDLGCYECGVHNYCGGRCPVQALASEAEGLIQYCQLIRVHVGVVMDYIPQISELLAAHSITLQDLYDCSAVFAQFTDVTP